MKFKKIISWSMFAALLFTNSTQASNPKPSMPGLEDEPSQATAAAPAAGVEIVDVDKVIEVMLARDAAARARMAVTEEALIVAKEAAKPPKEAVRAARSRDLDATMEHYRSENDLEHARVYKVVKQAVVLNAPVVVHGNNYESLRFIEDWKKGWRVYTPGRYDLYPRSARISEEGGKPVCHLEYLIQAGDTSWTQELGERSEIFLKDLSESLGTIVLWSFHNPREGMKNW